MSSIIGKAFQEKLWKAFLHPNSDNIFLYFNFTAQKMKFFIKNFFSKCDQNPRKLSIWSHLLKKSLMENFIFVQWTGTVQTVPKIKPENTWEIWTALSPTNCCSNSLLKCGSVPPCENCPYSEFFWPAFSRIWTEYEEIRSISPYSVQMRENTDQKNSEYGHFSRSVPSNIFRTAL